MIALVGEKRTKSFHTDNMRFEKMLLFINVYKAHLETEKKSVMKEKKPAILSPKLEKEPITIDR